LSWGADVFGLSFSCRQPGAIAINTAGELQRMVNPRKAYPVDPGLIPVYDRVGRANVGHALETAAYEWRNGG
jgi:hypothetical protein